MNRNETLSIMSILKAAYPNYYRDMSRADAEGVVNLWTAMLSDYPVQVVSAAVKAHIATDKKGFPPHIGAIIDAIVKITAPEEMTEAEAWAHVSKALRNSNYNSESEFAALPEVIQRIVGSPAQLREWAMMDSDTVQSVLQSNFMRSYRARAENERQYLALPADVRGTMSQLAAAMSMPALEDGRHGT